MLKISIYIFYIFNQKTHLIAIKFCSANNNGKLGEI